MAGDQDKARLHRERVSGGGTGNSGSVSLGSRFEAPRILAYGN